MLLSLNNWAHNVRNESSIKSKAKAKADPEIERAVRFVTSKTKTASPVIVIQSSRDIDKAADIVKPCKSRQSRTCRRLRV